MSDMVFTFGRFNPPHIGHEYLIQKLSFVAGINPFRIYCSQTTHPITDPLPYSIKIDYMKKIFSKYAENIMSDKRTYNYKAEITPIVQKMYEEGYNNLTMVVGSDRVLKFKNLFEYLNDSEKYNFQFDSIDVIEHHKYPISATHMREIPSNGNMDSFLQGVPAGFDGGEALYYDVRKYMGYDMIDMKDRYVFVTQDEEDVDAIRISIGKFANVIYNYGKVSLPQEEDLNENGTMPFRFEYNILDNAGLPLAEFDDEFDTLIGDILVDIIDSEDVNATSD